MSITKQMEKDKIEKRIKQIDEEKKILQTELKYAGIPDRMRDEFRIQFGWPKISQELGLAKKLDSETYKRLYDEIEKIIERVVLMVPESKKSWLKSEKK